jgi:large subunit ribosomal protein L22
MPGPKTNEREGTRAVLRHSRMSAYKVREVLDIIRNQPVGRAREILRFSERDAAIVVGKLLDSAVANAETNDGMDPEELYVATAYADEGTTIKRWRPRARGRATRIRKRTCHVTLIVARLPEERLVRQRARAAAEAAARRGRRVTASRGDAGRNRAERRRGQQAAAESAAAIAAAEDEQGIVDQDAAAIAEADEELAEGGTGATEEPVPTEAEDEGIVDQDAPAVEAANEANEANEAANDAAAAEPADEAEEGEK